MDEKLVHQMNEARMIAASEEIIYPLIDLLIKNRLDLACALFRDGKNNLEPHIAYITALKDIAQDLRSKQIVGNKVVDMAHRRQK